MKKITLILILIAFPGYSQIEDILIGEWKATAINRDNIFYNSENDSISVNPDSNFPIESLQVLRIAMKVSISDKQYFFNDVNELKCVIAPGFEIILIYEIVKEEKLINLYEKDKNQTSVGNIEYQFNGSDLELKMTIKEESSSYLILEKVKPF